jgi:GNAT superfamily N-acetyltransferase
MGTTKPKIKKTAQSKQKIRTAPSKQHKEPEITFRVSIPRQNHYQSIAYHKNKEIGQFNIEFQNVNTKLSKEHKRIPAMSICVNENYQRKGIAAQLMAKLLTSLNSTQLNRLKSLYINTDASERKYQNKPHHPINNPTFWERRGLKNNENTGYMTVPLTTFKKSIQL